MTIRTTGNSILADARDVATPTGSNLKEIFMVGGPDEAVTAGDNDMPARDAGNGAGKPD